MATRPDPAETAVKIARTMVNDMQIIADQGAPVMSVRLHAEKNGVSTQDFPDGLEHGVTWDMFKYENNWVTLTQAGFKAA